VIQEHIKKPLAEELLFGKLAKGGNVKVGVKDGKIDLRFEDRQSAPELEEAAASDGGLTAGEPMDKDADLTPFSDWSRPVLPPVCSSPTPSR
jgi:hypothetical protein